MSILITGGTGFLGKKLVKKLIPYNDVVIFAKDADFEMEKSGVSFATGNMRNKAELEKAFMKTPEIDAVYHLAANLDESDRNMYYDNVMGTDNVIELCRKHMAQRLVFMSSCGVTGYGKISKEDSPYRPNTLYEKSKADSEKLVVNSGLPYTVVRAPIIIGPNDIWLKIAEAAKKNYPVIGSGKNRFHLAYISDVVDFLILAKDSEKALGQVFNVATSDIKTYKEVYALMCKSLGMEFKERHVPAFLMKLLALLHETKSGMLGRKPKLIKMRASIKRLVVDRAVSTGKAKEILGFEPRYDTAQAVDETIRYFRNNSMI